jgi:SAM-dependent methyltransferase
MAARDDWDLHWERYAAAAARNPAQRMRHGIVSGLLARDIGAGPARVLDIGSGQGDLLARLRGVLPGASLAGLERSAKGAALSRQKLPGVAFVVADLCDPPADLDGYSGWATHAICSEVLEHVDDPVGFLRKARGLLAPGARMIVTVPGGPISAFDRHIGHRRHFDRKAVADSLTAGGFDVERSWLAGFPFFNLYRAVVIARGRSLAADVEGGGGGLPAAAAGAAMGLFGFLFRFNFPESPFGWQVIALARNPGAPPAGPARTTPR